MLWIHFLFIYYFSYVFISTIGLSVLWLLNLNFTATVLNRFNPLYISITAYSFVTALLVYLESSGSVALSVFNSLILLKVILTYAFQVYLVLFLHDILQFKRAKKINRLVISAALFCGFFSIIFITGTDFWTTVRSMNALPFSLTLFTAVINVYLIPLTVIQLSKEKNIAAQTKRVIKHALTIAIISLPGFYFDIFQSQVLTLFPDFPGGVTYSIVFFSILNIYFIYMSYKWIVQKVSALTPQPSTTVKENTYNFSKRELEVLAILKTGKRNKDIADVLFITEATVKKHIKNMFEKTGAASRHELILKVPNLR